MPKDVFRKHAIISSIITVMAITVVIGFCVMMFRWYSPPNEDNTFVISGTVSEAYYTKTGIVISFSNGETVRLVYPWGINNFCTTIGYDLEQLADLLEGEDVKCRRMNDLPWAVEICIDDIRIDNYSLTRDQVLLTRPGIVILGLIMLAFVICGDVMYLQPKYKSYLQEKRKLARKEKRELKKKGKTP